MGAIVVVVGDLKHAATAEGVKYGVNDRAECPVIHGRAIYALSIQKALDFWAVVGLYEVENLIHVAPHLSHAKDVGNKFWAQE